MSSLEISPYILNDITQIITAVGVILTAISSIMNRRKLDKVAKKFDAAVVTAEETKQEALDTGRLALTKIEEIHTAAVAKIEEVKQDIQTAKTETIDVIKKNGHGNGRS